jgi:hypothetical protein
VRKNDIGDGPIQAEYARQMQAIAYALDDVLNPDNKRTTGFVLLVFPFDSKDGRCNYISNGADRDDIVRLMREQIKRFEES